MEDMVSLAALPWWDVPVVSCIVWCSLGCGRAWPSYVVLTVAVRRGPHGAGALGVQSCLAGRLLLDLSFVLEISSRTIQPLYPGTQRLQVYLT